MKMISEKVGAGVGTLYNYYGNKKQLYTTVLQRSWEQTYSNLDIALNSSRSIDEKFEIFIKILYEEMENRKGLGKFYMNQPFLIHKVIILLLKLKILFLKN